MSKHITKEFIVGKNMIVDDVKICRGDVIQILPLDFIDDAEHSYKNYVEECGIQTDLAVDVGFYTPENYALQYIDGTIEPKLNIPMNILELPYMFVDLKVRTRRFKYTKKD